MTNSIKLIKGIHLYGYTFKTLSQKYFQRNLPQVMHVLVQNSLTSLLATPRRDRLQLLFNLDLPMATSIFVSHLSFNCGHVVVIFLQLRFVLITEGSVSIQPESVN